MALRSDSPAGDALYATLAPPSEEWTAQRLFRRIEGGITANGQRSRTFVEHDRLMRSQRSDLARTLWADSRAKVSNMEWTALFSRQLFATLRDCPAHPRHFPFPFRVPFTPICFQPVKEWCEKGAPEEWTEKAPT